MWPARSFNHRSTAAAAAEVENPLAVLRPASHYSQTVPDVVNRLSARLKEPVAIGCSSDTKREIATRKSQSVVVRVADQGHAPTSLMAPRAAIVLSTSFTVCAADRNHASNCDGGG